MYFWKFPKNVIVSYQGASALSWLARVKRLLIIIWILKFSSTWSVYSMNKVQDTSVVLESTHILSLGGLQYHTGILFSKCTICHPKTSFWVKKTSCRIRTHDCFTSPSPSLLSNSYTAFVAIMQWMLILSSTWFAAAECRFWPVIYMYVLPLVLTPLSPTVT